MQPARELSGSLSSSPGPRLDFGSNSKTLLSTGREQVTDYEGVVNHAASRSLRTPPAVASALATGILHSTAPQLGIHTVCGDTPYLSNKDRT